MTVKPDPSVPPSVLPFLHLGVSDATPPHPQHAHMLVYVHPPSPPGCCGLAFTVLKGFYGENGFSGQVSVYQ